MYFDKYTKITYQSEPIGKEKIVLYLTTFDLEAFKKDQALKTIPTKRQRIIVENNKIDLKVPYTIEELEGRLETYVREVYGKQILEMKSYIEMNRKIPEAQWYENNKGV